LFFNGRRDPRDLPPAYRRHRQRCIRDRIVAVGGLLIYRLWPWPAELNFNVETPERVKVVIDDKLILDGPTPFVYKLKPGTHTVEIKADGYEAYTVTQEFQKNIVYNMPTSLKSAAPDNPTLLFATNPADAVVEIDGREYAGASPKRIVDFGAGSYEAKVRKVGFATQTLKFDIEKDSEPVIKQDTKLEVVAVKLTLESTPKGATYSVYETTRGKRLFKGQTPATVDLEGNETYKIVVEKSGIPKWEQEFGPTSEATPKLMARLVDKPDHPGVASKDPARDRDRGRTRSLHCHTTHRDVDQTKPPKNEPPQKDPTKKKNTSHKVRRK